MKMKNEKSQDDEITLTIITIYKYFENKDLKEKRYEIASIPAVCKNCGFKSLVYSFLNRNKDRYVGNEEDVDTIDLNYYNNFLKCPKCGSSYITTKKIYLLFDKI